MSENSQESNKKKRIIVSQSDFPQLPLSKSLRIVKAIWDQYAGKPTAPHNVALAIGLEPTSGFWRNLAGTSIAYGLTKGGYAAKNIEISPIGKRIVAPTSENDDKKAICEAVLKPNIMRKFYERYNHAKFPDDLIAKNVLLEIGLPQKRIDEALSIIKENGLYSGILKETQTGYFVAIDETDFSVANVITDDKDENTIDNDKVTPKPKPLGVTKPNMTLKNGLYINFEIHIAADASIETIEAIFKNMKKYLFENE